MLPSGQVQPADQHMTIGPPSSIPCSPLQYMWAQAQLNQGRRTSSCWDPFSTLHWRVSTCDTVQPCCKLFFSRYVREVGKGSVTLWRSTILLWVRFGCLSTGECYGYGWILIWATLVRVRPLACDTYCVYYYMYACMYTTLCLALHVIIVLILHCMHSHLLLYHQHHSHYTHMTYIIHLTPYHTYMTYIIHHIYHCIHTTLHTYNTVCCVGTDSSLAADRRN